MIEQYTYIGFLITCVVSLSGFSVWLVKKVIKITETNTETYKDLKNSIEKLDISLDNNTEAIKELKYSLNHK